MNEEGTGFAAFALYNSIKLHFTSSYDYFKYHGKSRVNKDQFLKRKDKYSFYKISRRYSLEEIKNLYVSNFVYQEIKWVGDITGPEGEINYKKWLKIHQSLKYTFEEDLNTLFDSVDSPNEIIQLKSGKFPKLLSEVMEQNIQIETLCILQDIMGFFNLWQKMDDDIIWPSWKMKCEKYIPFIDYDHNKYKIILKEKIKEYV